MMAAPSEPELRGVVLENEPMSRHTSWRVGGPARLFFRPQDVEDLSAFLQQLDPAMPLLWVGLGSNLLIRDGGFHGAVISSSTTFKTLERVGDQHVRAGSGLPCTQLARQCIRWGLGPSEFFAGIPGTVGGALAMNAGAHGGETWERVVSVTTIDRAGVVRERGADEFDVAYRQVRGAADEWFVEALFGFEPDAQPSMDVLKRMLDRRKDTQPLGLPSCGSVFRNPPGDHAARLIESAGLKGYRVGGAEVSEKHANFIINIDDARAQDIERLINHVQQTVAEKHGVTLQHEVRMAGDELP